MSRFGTITDPASVKTVFVESAAASDLQAKTNAALAAIFAATPPRVVTGITLAGGGDGHTFMVLIESAVVAAVNGGLPGPASVQCYLAATEETLAVVRAAQIVVGPLADEQLAGAAKGARFMGLITLGSPITFPSPGALGFAEFFALMPGDNAAPVAVGGAVEFPQNGLTSGVATRASASQFLIASTGTYEVAWQVSVTEAGQLALEQNGSLDPKSVVGRATGTSQIVSSTIISTHAGDPIRIINPAGNPSALTITPLAGGTHPVSARLTFRQLQG